VRLNPFGVLAAGALACATWAVAIEPLWLEKRELEVPFPGLPRALDGIRLGLLSDLHAGAWAPQEHYRRAVRILAGARVDVLLLAGDIAGHRAGQTWKEVLAPLAGLEPPLGRLAVLGGHDHRFDARAVAHHLERLGYTVLRNQAVPLRRGGQALWVVGLDDNSDLPGRDDFEEACREVPAGAPGLLLAHSPDAVMEASRRGLGLVLSGHTHGGQVRLPFWGSILRVTELPRHYDQGLSRHGDTHLFVSRGMASTYRLRFFCRPDVAVLTLRSAPRA